MNYNQTEPYLLSSLWRFHNVRKDLVIGKVKVFDVRDRFSGALVIEKHQEGLQSGDRAIPWIERYGS